jgi:hypothetical protein
MRVIEGVTGKEENDTLCGMELAQNRKSNFVSKARLSY